MLTKRRPSALGLLLVAWAVTTAAQEKPDRAATAAPATPALSESAGVLHKGAAWETPYFIRRSNRPGPVVVVVGGVHGDEPAGAAAAEQIRHWPITRGTLAALPCANRAALAARTRNIPGVAKESANLNRDFPKAGRTGPASGGLAQGTWEWVRSLKPDWLVDLHEGSGIRGAGSKSVGSSAIVLASPEADRAANVMLQAVNGTIEEPKKRFVRLGPPVDGSLARAAGEHIGARAMILETSIHDLAPDDKDQEGQRNPKDTKDQPPTAAKEQPLSRRVRQHRLMVAALLEHLEMVDPSFDPDRLPGRGAAPYRTWVAIYDAAGTGGKGGAAVERILGGAGMQVARVGREEILAESLPGFDLLVVPGGSGSKEAAALGEDGRKRVKRFVDDGGGYLGICAGAYLSTSGFAWSLKVLNAKTLSSRWQRGRGTVKIELTPAGRKLLGDRPGLLDVLYANGPVITRAGDDALSDYEVLAFYRTELARNGAPPGVMVNSPAIASGICGKGRVVFISPHPEQTPGLEDLVLRAAQWTAGEADRPRSRVPKSDETR